MSNKGIIRKLDKAFITASIVSSMIVPAFAAEAGGGAGTLTGAITSLTSQITSALTGVISGIAVAALGICILIWFVSKDEKKVQGAFDWGKRILIGYLLFLLINPIIAFVQSLV